MQLKHSCLSGVYGLLAFLVFYALAGSSHAAPKDDALAEVLIHKAFDVAEAGIPASIPAGQGATLALTIVDTATGKPTPCRVNVVGADDNYYEPINNPLRPWSMQRLGNRPGKGPFRYYGWFYYSLGSDTLRVPAGECRVEVWKGFEYTPVTHTLSVLEGETHRVEISLDRTLGMAEEHWYGGDPHIHLNRLKAGDTKRAMDLVAAEDIDYSFLLAMNDPRDYVGTMNMQLWPQQEGMGRNSIHQRGRYTLSSGQEYRNSPYGHILLLLNDDLVFKGQTLNPNHWPLFNAVGAETRWLGGASFHAHGGYEKEIYADFTQGNTDGVELLQFAVYRGIGLAGWYHILNAGFRFPAVGASDYPYCRALGDCRTYVYMPNEPTMENWVEGAKAGQSFITTGPMLLLEVDGVGPGGTLEADKAGTNLTIYTELSSVVAQVDTLDILRNGVVVQSIPVDNRQMPFIYKTSIKTEGTQWVAAHGYAKASNGREDVEAHTNPVFVEHHGKVLRNTASIQWLIKRIENKIKEVEYRDFPQKLAVLIFFNDAMSDLINLLPKNER